MSIFKPAPHKALTSGDDPTYRVAGNFLGIFLVLLIVRRTLPLPYLLAGLRVICFALWGSDLDFKFISVSDANPRPPAYWRADVLWALSMGDVEHCVILLLFLLGMAWFNDWHAALYMPHSAPFWWHCSPLR